MEFRIKEAREKCGLSQKDLAEIIGVAPSTLNGYESGKHDPKSELLVKIARACRVTTDYLLFHDLEKENAPSVVGEAEKHFEDTLLDLFNQLNAEGKEILVNIATGLVFSGEYKKLNEDFLGEKEA